MATLPYKTATTLPFGSRILTIDAVTYIAENFETSAGGQLIERTTELGAPNGAILIEQAKTGSATLQFATTTTAIPERGDEFTADTITYFLTEVSAPETANGFKTCRISFREKV